MNRLRLHGLFRNLLTPQAAAAVEENINELQGLFANIPELLEIHQSLNDINLNSNLINGALSENQEETQNVFIGHSQEFQTGIGLVHSAIIRTSSLLLHPTKDGVSKTLIPAIDLTIPDINDASFNLPAPLPQDAFTIPNAIHYIWAGLTDTGILLVNPSNVTDDDIFLRSTEESLEEDVNNIFNGDNSPVVSITNYAFLGVLVEGSDYLNGEIFNLNRTNGTNENFGGQFNRVFGISRVNNTPNPDSVFLSAGQISILLNGTDLDEVKTFEIDIGKGVETHDHFYSASNAEPLIIPFSNYGSVVDMDLTVRNPDNSLRSGNIVLSIKFDYVKLKNPRYINFSMDGTVTSGGTSQSQLGNLETVRDSNFGDGTNGYMALNGAVDDNNVVFTVSNEDGYTAGTIRVVSDGLYYLPGAGLEETDPENGIFTMDLAPLNNIIAEYIPL